MHTVCFWGLTRSIAKRRALVKSLTDAVASSYGVAKKDITVYVFDSAEDTLAHSGRLFSDGGRKTTPKNKPWLAHEY